ncbi:hypothetical protein PMIN01_13178 [Paraphaeosphaeria minitans]|uniref:Uncharacterized protein n=1 Tax=Paraphaeosphaeria minitans TaxID=565426 RepID=A0A9P6KIX9_9PLEO|nr:hypothetical protein PMIN01_13178 [Paraphaeosphaeria minitans]
MVRGTLCDALRQAIVVAFEYSRATVAIRHILHSPKRYTPLSIASSRASPFCPRSRFGPDPDPRCLPLDPALADWPTLFATNSRSSLHTHAHATKAHLHTSTCQLRIRLRFAKSNKICRRKELYLVQAMLVAVCILAWQTWAMLTHPTFADVSVLVSVTLRSDQIRSDEAHFAHGFKSMRTSTPRPDSPSMTATHPCGLYIRPSAIGSVSQGFLTRASDEIESAGVRRTFLPRIENALPRKQEHGSTPRHILVSRSPQSMRAQG